jgi:hypothetical protein
LLATPQAVHPVLEALVEGVDVAETAAALAIHHFKGRSRIDKKDRLVNQETKVVAEGGCD